MAFPNSSSDEQHPMSSTQPMPMSSPLLNIDNGPYLAATHLVVGDAAGLSSVPSIDVANQIIGPFPTVRDHLQAIIGNEGRFIERLAACETQLNSNGCATDQLQDLVDRAQATYYATLAIQRHHHQTLASQQFHIGENYTPLQVPGQHTRLDSVTPAYYQTMSPTSGYEQYDGGDEDAQQHMLGPSSDQPYPSPIAYQTSSPFNNQLYEGSQDYDQQSYNAFTPTSYQHSPTVSSLPYNSFNMSAQCSSHGFDANSSYHLSTMTGPTSAAEFSDVATDFTLNCGPPLYNGWPLQGQPDQSFLTSQAPDFDRNANEQSLEYRFMNGGS
jgi:hypothetical protein